MISAQDLTVSLEILVTANLKMYGSIWRNSIGLHSDVWSSSASPSRCWTQARAYARGWVWGLKKPLSLIFYKNFIRGVC